MTTINGINTTIPIPIASGGTAATTASGARTNLGLVIGTNVEAWSAGLDSLATLAAAGTAGFVSQSGANVFAARTLTAGTGILITNPTGLAGNPTISLNSNTANTLQGFDGAGNPVSIAAGANITISGGSISSSVTNTATAQSSVIQGGDLGINPWQKATTINVTSTPALTADRWFYYTAGSPVLTATITQDTDVPTVAQTGFYTQYSLGLTVTSADATPSASTVYSFRHCLEGYNWAQIAQQASTLTFWVKSTVTGTYSVCLQNAGATINYLASYTVSSSNTWEQKTITFTASPSAGTWNYGVGAAMYLHFTMAAGSGLTGSTFTWGAGTAMSATGAVNAVGTNANVFKLALLKWELGSSFTGWFPEKFSNVLAQCQRFYFKTFPQATAPAQNAGTPGTIGWAQITAASTAQNGPYITFPVSMYSPSGNVTFYNPSASNAQPRDVSVGADCSSVAGYQVSNQGLGITYTNAIGSALGNVIQVHLTVDSSI